MTEIVDKRTIKQWADWIGVGQFMKMVVEIAYGDVVDAVLDFVQWAHNTGATGDKVTKNMDTACKFEARARRGRAGRAKRGALAQLESGVPAAGPGGVVVTTTPDAAHALRAAHARVRRPPTATTAASSRV
jgi:hypothetical protein